MTDWVRVHAYAQHTYVQTFPITSFLVSGISHYTDTIKDISVNDILYMLFEPENKYDSTAIVIKRNDGICGYVPKDLKEKILPYVPSSVKVIDKHFFKGNYSLRVDIIE
jgi:hypothetical protein